MKKTIFYIIFLAIILIVAYLWQNNNSQLSDNNNNTNNTHEDARMEIPEEYKIVLNIQFSEQDIRELPYAYMEEQSIFAITQNTAEAYLWEFTWEDYGEMGILVTQIGDKVNGQDNKYWQYEVNNKSPMLSADNFIPQVGDIITWKFQESEF